MVGCPRICQLLDLWISFYPTDFAVSGASSALAALIKSILNKTYLLHYGAEFLPFLEMVSSLKDKDASWGLKVDDENSDTSSVSDEENAFLVDQPVSQRSASPSPLPADNGSSNPVGSNSGFARERKASLPLTAKALIAPPSTTPGGGIPLQATTSSREPMALSYKGILRALQSTSQTLHTYDPADIAQEMTRLQCQFFLRIEVCRLRTLDLCLRSDSLSLGTALAAACAGARQEGFRAGPDYRLQPSFKSFW